MQLSLPQRQKFYELWDQVKAALPPQQLAQVALPVVQIEALIPRGDGRAARWGRGPAAKVQAAQAYDAFRVVDHATGQYVELVGWDALSRVLGYAEPTLRVKFSRGRGRFQYEPKDTGGLDVFRLQAKLPLNDFSRQATKDVLTPLRRC